MMLEQYFDTKILQQSMSPTILRKLKLFQTESYAGKRYVRQTAQAIITRLYKHNLRDMPAVPIEVLPYIRGIQLVLSSYEGYTKGKREKQIN